MNVTTTLVTRADRTVVIAADTTVDGTPYRAIGGTVVAALAGLDRMVPLTGAVTVHLPIGGPVTLTDDLRRRMDAARMNGKA